MKLELSTNLAIERGPHFVYSLKKQNLCSYLEAHPDSKIGWLDLLFGKFFSALRRSQVFRTRRGNNFMRLGRRPTVLDFLSGCFRRFLSLQKEKDAWVFNTSGIYFSIFLGISYTSKKGLCPTNREPSDHRFSGYQPVAKTQRGMPPANGLGAESMAIMFWH